MLFTSDMQSFSTLILSLAVESETADELMLISTESHTLAASAGQRRERGRVLRIQEKWGRISVLFFFVFFSFSYHQSMGVHMHAPATRVQLTHEGV